MNLGVVQFAVTSRPTVEATTLYIAGAGAVIDGLLGGLLVSRRTETDVIDIEYTAGDPVRPSGSSTRPCKPFSRST